MNYIDPTNKLLKHIDRIAEIQAGGHPAPVNVEIDLSNRCNLGCAGCHFSHTHTRGHFGNVANVSTVGDLMDISLIRKIIVDLWHNGVRSITWTGGGEPTLHPRFDEVIESTHAIGLAQGIYTNGTQITPKRAELMKKSMDWVYVSLDRADRETYKEYKKADAFEKALAGIENLVNADGNATIGVGFLLSRQSLPYARDMLDLGQDLGVDYIQFRPEISFDFDNQSSGPEDNAWIKAAIMWLDGVKGERKVNVDVSRFEMYRNWKGHGYKTCHWSQMQTVITPNGKVWTCVNRRGFEGDCIGDLTQETFAEVWQKSCAKIVDSKCRVMCRGHIPNLTLDHMMKERTGHDNFV
jgi:MoaA/NifB/PqqE/SkfB family radical SAM enzyme